MGFEKKLIDSIVVEVKFHSPEWEELMGAEPFYHNMPVDLIQLFNCKKEFWLAEILPLIIDKQQDTEEEKLMAIPMANLHKKDCKALDLSQTLKVKTKRDKPKMPPSGNKNVPIGIDIPMPFPPNVQIEYMRGGDNG